MKLLRSIWNASAVVLPQLAFWGWNGLFLLLFGAPSVAGILAGEVWDGRLPWDFAAIFLGLMAAPLMASAAYTRVWRRSEAVATLFFGIELPLCFAALVRLFLLREVTPAVLHMLLVVGLAGFVLALDLFRKRTAPLSLPELAGHTVLLITAVWPAAVVAFFVPPAAVGFVDSVAYQIRWIFRMSSEDFVRLLEASPMFLLGMSFFLLTSVLFLFGPAMFFAVLTRTYARLFRETARATTTFRAGLATVLGLGVCLAPAAFLNHQPQVAVLARLESPPADDAARRALLADADALREGLRNAYLAKYRYWSSTGSSREIAGIYEDYGVGEEAQAAFNWLVTPFLYEGEKLGDPDRAAELYMRVFDTPLQEGERDAILEALNATWERSSVEAGVLDVNGEKVLLAHQEVHVTMDGDLATVQIDEQYRNQTPDQQEVYYYFTLPTSAAVTGLWLSDDPTDPERYPGVLAPRGAAQQVYLEQRRERRDPALLEQVGPQQYRLRAFPIAARPHRNELAPPLCVRLTYTTLVDGEGVPLPRLLERRNVFWDDRTERVGVADPGEGWFVGHVPAAVKPVFHHAIVRGQHVYAIPGDGLKPAKGRRYAVVLDRSRSMAAHADEVSASLEYLRASVAPTNSVDVYVTAGWGAGSPVRTTLDALPSDILWFGSETPFDLLGQYDTLRGERTYDAVFVLTDDGGYDVAAEHDRTTSQVPNRWWAPEPLATTPVAPTDTWPARPWTGGPVWMVHLGGALAPAYDDVILEAIQGSHGGVGTTLSEVLPRVWIQAEVARMDVLGGYAWSVGDEDPVFAVTPEYGPFAALAARQLVLATSRTADMTDVANLDAVHATAKSAHVVTPYTSLIALVDEAQRKRLKELEEQEDRFAREAESGVESLTAPSDAFDVTAVPEPEEWALLGVAGALWLVGRRRKAVARG